MEKRRLGRVPRARHPRHLTATTPTTAGSTPVRPDAVCAEPPGPAHEIHAGHPAETTKTACRFFADVDTRPECAALKWPAPAPAARKREPGRVGLPLHAARTQQLDHERLARRRAAREPTISRGGRPGLSTTPFGPSRPSSCTSRGEARKARPCILVHERAFRSVACTALHFHPLTGWQLGVQYLGLQGRHRRFLWQLLPYSMALLSGTPYSPRIVGRRDRAALVWAM